MVQKLEDYDYAARTWCVNWCRQDTQSDCSVLNRRIFSDECVFHMYGNVNKRNVRMWGTENRREYKEES